MLKTLSAWISSTLSPGVQTPADSGTLSLSALPVSDRRGARRWRTFKTVMSAESTTYQHHWQNPRLTTSALRVTTKTQRLLKEAYSDRIEESLKPRASWFIPGYEWLAFPPGRDNNRTVSFARKER